MLFLDTRTSEELNDIANTMIYNKTQREMANELYEILYAKMEENGELLDSVIAALNSMPKEKRYSILDEYVSQYSPVLYLAVAANGEYLRSSEYIFLNDFVSYPEYVVPEETILEDTASEE